MNTNIMKTLAFAAFALAATSTLSMGATYTWVGGGANGNWSTAANWNSLPTVATHNLIFAGTSQLDTTNNRLSAVSTIFFAKGAGAFTLSGNTLTLGTGADDSGSIVNNSTSKQVINLNLIMNGNRTINTHYGDILINGNIANDGSTRTLTKEGQYTLELTGTNTWGARTYINGGTLLLDASTGSMTTSQIWFGNYSTGNTTDFEVKGGNYATGAALLNLSYTANTVKANKDVNIRFGSLDTMAGASVLQFDVSAEASSISFTTAPSLTAGRILQTTVKDATGKTSFATRVLNDDSGFYDIIALTGLTDLSTNPATSATSNAYLNLNSGSYSNNTSNRNMSSLTLQGAGDGAVTVAGSSMRPNEILMEEGTGDYIFNANMSLSSGHFYVHQHSTNGTLTFNGTLLATNTAGFSKAGAGTVIISSTSSSAYTGYTYVQNGTLELDGALTSTGQLHVYDGATLLGGGSLGSVAATSTRIREGGTLQATSSRALSIRGTLRFDSDSLFTFTLGAGEDFVDVTGTVTLYSDARLALALVGTPDFDTPIYLLKSGTIINGNFVYNGATMTDGTAFSLGGYDFTYYQDSQNIWVQAVPEPSVALLLGLGAAILLIRRRR